MTDALKHRGPDDQGIKTFPHVALGQRRLAIIDLSPGGHQPMSYDQNRYWITFNGEIYNYQEIKKKLLAKGYRFSNQSDTEVILAAYQAYGEKCLQHFQGMFAFALYDRQEKVLFAARDRLGKKPFKYYFDGKNFVFASEVKSILQHPAVRAVTDFDALRQYMYWGFVPSPKTGFMHIAKLPAGHYLLLKDNQLKVKRYWQLSFEPNYDRSEKETAEELRSLIENAVKLRLISDVPVGAFLSGGIDSTIVVGIMSQLIDQPVRTFTIGVKGWENDETEAAEKTAKKFHTKHKTLQAKLDVKSVLPKIVKAYDEPFADSSAIPSYAVSQLAKKHVTVALNGDGGDENFLGYSNYETFLFTQKYHFLSPVFSLAHGMLKPWQNQLYQSPLYQRALRISHIMKDNPYIAYPLYARGYSNYIQGEAFDISDQLDTYAEFTSGLPTHPSLTVNDILYHDLTKVLPDGLMTKIDIATMQFGLEGRSPLLDHKVVEFAATIPWEMKYKNGQTKYILREAFADIIPKHVAHLPKRGFVPPMNTWLKHELRETLFSRLTNPDHQLFSLVDFDAVQQILKWHNEDIADYSPQLWKFLMLALWFEEWIE